MELTSHAVLLEGKLYTFDPIPLLPEAMTRLIGNGIPVAIILTSENHERAAIEWREQWRVPIWSSVNSAMAIGGVQRFPDGQNIWMDWQLHPLPGGAGGETAFRSSTQSLVVLGDAVVNLPARRLELLPDKYCQAPAALRLSLRKMIKQPFARLLTAHGVPILEDASTRVAALL